MLGAFVGWMLLHYLGIGYWLALILVPLLVGMLGIIMERFLIRKLYDVDHIYGLLLTFGIALMIQALFLNIFGVSGQRYPVPEILKGTLNLSFMYLPIYRGWVIVASAIVCLSTWYLIERTKLGSYLRAATENPELVQAFGIRVPILITLTYGAGVALAAFAGMMAAPVYQVSPVMGVDIVIIVFAIVVIGGMGSISGAIVAGFGLGVVEGLTRVFYPEASSVVIFVVMAIVLLVRPSGLFGKAA
jgi:branched-chain amino acid transport system permease protein